MYLYSYTHIYVHFSICIVDKSLTATWVGCTDLYDYVCMYTCMFICACVCVCMYICVYVYMYMYIYLMQFVYTYNIYVAYVHNVRIFCVCIYCKKTVYVHIITVYIKYINTNNTYVYTQYTYTMSQLHWCTYLQYIHTHYRVCGKTVGRKKLRRARVKHVFQVGGDLCIYSCIHIYTFADRQTYNIHTNKRACVHTYRQTDKIPSFTHIYIHTYIHSHIHTYIHKYIHTYVHTCYMHICIPLPTHKRTKGRTHVHTYTHTHIHTNKHVKKWSKSRVRTKIRPTHMDT